MASKPLAKIHNRFRLQVEALRSAASEMAASVTDEHQRPWMTLDHGSWSGNPFDIPGMTGAFDRDDINQHYAEMLSDPANLGSLGSSLALKLQVDWLAVLERAFRTRHASSVRCAVHAAARRKGHSSGAGIFSIGTLGYVQNIIQKGSS